MMRTLTTAAGGSDAVSGGVVAVHGIGPRPVATLPMLLEEFEAGPGVTT